jgi:AmpD protein
MMLHIEQGWLVDKNVRQKLSPNFGSRPPIPITLLVIHNISLPPGEFGGGYIDQLFTNQLDATQHASFEQIADLQVSAHLLIDRQGVITQYVSFLNRAWHAGKSLFGGRENCNDFSIGIELEGTDDQPYTEVQYWQLTDVGRCLLQNYPGITVENIVGHSDIAAGRKTDPGPSFDWKKFHQLLAGGRVK